MMRSMIVCILAVAALGNHILVLAKMSTPDPSISSPVLTSTPAAALPSGSISPTKGVSPSSSTLKTSFVSPTAFSQSASLQSTPSISPSQVMSSSMVVSSSSNVSPNMTSSVIMHSSSAHPIPPGPDFITIKDKLKNKTCLSAKLEVDFFVTYKAEVNKTENTTKTESATIILDNKSTAFKYTGSCNYTSGLAYFYIHWSEDIHGLLHSFYMNFNLSETTKKWDVPSISVSLQTNDSKFHDAVNATINATATGSLFGHLKNQTKYVCNKQVEITMSNNVSATFKQIILQPFSSDSIDDNGAATHCSADESKNDDDDNTVPIAVGAALGGLVLIVLIAYIVGRRRSSSRGYEQV